MWKLPLTSSHIPVYTFLKFPHWLMFLLCIVCGCRYYLFLFFICSKGRCMLISHNNSHFPSDIFMKKPQKEEVKAKFLLHRKPELFRMLHAKHEVCWDKADWKVKIIKFYLIFLLPFTKCIDVKNLSCIMSVMNRLMKVSGLKTNTHRKLRRKCPLVWLAEPAKTTWTPMVGLVDYFTVE